MVGSFEKVVCLRFRRPGSFLFDSREFTRSNQNGQSSKAHEKNFIYPIPLYWLITRRFQNGLTMISRVAVSISTFLTYINQPVFSVLS